MSYTPYCGISEAGCLLDTLLQLIIFITLGFYSVKFSEILQKDKEYDFSKITHFGKLAFECVLLIMSLSSLIINCVMTKISYECPNLGIHSTQINKIILIPITIYEHKYVGCTSPWFKIVAFVIVLDTSLQMMFEQIFQYQAEEGFPALLFAYFSLLFCFYGYLTLNPWDNDIFVMAKEEKRMTKRPKSIQGSINTPLLDKLSHLPPKIASSLIKLNRVSGLNILRVKDNILYFMVYVQNNQQRTANKELVDIVQFLDNLRPFKLQGVDFEDLDELIDQIENDPRSDFKFLINQRRIIQTMMDQMVEGDESNQLLSIFLEESNRKVLYKKVQEMLILKSERNPSLTDSSINSYHEASNTIFSRDTMTRIEKSILTDGFNRIQVVLNEDGTEYIITLGKQESTLQQITFYKTREEAVFMVENIMKRYSNQVGLMDAAKLFLTFQQQEISATYLESTLKALLD